jgi:hypothetical protein
LELDKNDFIEGATIEMRAKTINSLKQDRLRAWISRFVLLLGLPFLLYFSYCWGVWGRNSLLLQYFFQCSCPIAIEEARYPKEVDVIVPACRYVGSIHSPSGRLLYVQEKQPSPTSIYLLNLQTGKKTPFILPEGSNHFLTDDLIFHSFYGDDQYILDINTGIQYPVQDATHIKPSIYSLGNIEPNLLLKALSQVDRIFLIDEVFQPVVALSLDFRTHPENTFTFNVLDFPGDEPNRVEQFLKQHKIIYHYVPASFPHEAMSPNERFIARDDGIYLVETGQKITEGYSASGSYRSYSGKYFSVRGWTYDSSGALYAPFFNPCLLETGFFIFEYPGCFIQVAQPLLKLKVPEEYLLSNGIQ